MSDVVLGWIQSFLTNQQISFNGQLSSKQSLLFGVPQGSVLGPLLYLLYLKQLILRHALHADGSQVYISVPVIDERVAVYSFAVCVHDINEWMRASKTAAEFDQDAGRLRPATEAR